MVEHLSYEILRSHLVLTYFLWCFSRTIFENTWCLFGALQKGFPNFMLLGNERFTSKHIFRFNANFANVAHALTMCTCIIILIMIWPVWCYSSNSCFALVSKFGPWTRATVYGHIDNLHSSSCLQKQLLTNSKFYEAFLNSLFRLSNEFKQWNK